MNKNKKSCPTFANGLAIKDDRLIHIDHLEKTHGKIYHCKLRCPDCSTRVKFNRCLKRKSYLSHIGSKGKYKNNGEGVLHEICKQELKKAFEKAFPNGKWEIEKVFPAIRKRGLRKVKPDLSSEIKIIVRGEELTIKLAVEIQASDMSSARFVERTEAYHKRGFVILWVKPLEGDLGERHRPKMVEKLIHAINFGWTYYWKEGFGECLQPVNYIPIKGYRAFKKPVAEAPVSLEDFIVERRESFQPKCWKKSIPACTIFVARQHLYKAARG